MQRVLSCTERSDCQAVSRLSQSEDADAGPCTSSCLAVLLGPFPLLCLAFLLLSSPPSL